VLRLSSLYLLKSVRNAPYLIVHRKVARRGKRSRRRRLRQWIRVTLEQQPCRQHGDADALGAKHLRQENHVGIHLRFPTGKHNPTDTKIAEASQLLLRSVGVISLATRIRQMSHITNGSCIDCAAK